MRRNLLLTSATVALMLGLSPAVAQDRTTKGDQATPNAQQQEQKIDRSEQHKNAVKTGNDERVKNSNDANNSNNAANSNNDRSTTRNSSADKSSADKDSASDKTGNKTTGTNTRTDSDKAADQSRSEPSKSQATNPNTVKPNATNANKSTTGAPDNSNAAKSATEPTNRASTTTEKAPAPGERSTTNAEQNRNQDQANHNADRRLRVSATLDSAAKTRLHSAITKLDARPVRNVNFSISVGTAVPRSVTLRPLPTSIVEVIPQYRGYDFFIVRDDIVIVEPRTHKIVDVIERSVPARAAVDTKSTRKLNLTTRQRQLLHKRYSSHRPVTTGTTSRIEEIEVGRAVPDTVVIQEFPEEVYREVPEIRSYRYIQRNDNIYVVDPADRRVIEEID